ncbi:MAG: hypothetical protein A4S15_02150 [Candidatus Raskinella chloraquaticus]|uniref:Uncharacterized protein n=1 Tax=Candidatus Raskinella chloraquaticus TaxID=1951219 RepID=A0A1W9HQM4_9HYPH|nr:MAG: hypothetical protein A4S15_02150 [Proteobacteria bacterium SG_bin8]
MVLDAALFAAFVRLPDHVSLRPSFKTAHSAIRWFFGFMLHCNINSATLVTLRRAYPANSLIYLTADWADGAALLY